MSLLSAPGGGFGGWWWRFPLFGAFVALLAALALLFTGHGILIGERRGDPQWTGCTYLTLQGILESEEAVWVGCRFLGQPGRMSGRQPMPFLV